MAMLSRKRWPRRVAIVGMGLIGGSLARAIRQAYPGIELIGIDHQRDVLDQAWEAGALDRATLRLEEGVTEADLVVLAVPISAILELLPRLSPLLPPKSVVTDTGSTKREICQVGEEQLGARFVGGHPIAGSERSGFAASRADLFAGRPWVLVPSSNGRNAKALERTTCFFKGLGVKVYTLDAARHDRVVAATSHLPQLLSWALADLLRRRAEGDELHRELLGGGAADWLRTAASPCKIWRDIFATNADEICETLEELFEELRGWQARWTPYSGASGVDFRKRLSIRSSRREG